VERRDEGDEGERREEWLKVSSSEVRFKRSEIRESLSLRRLAGRVHKGQVQEKPQLLLMARWRSRYDCNGSISGFVRLGAKRGWGNEEGVQTCNGDFFSSIDSTQGVGVVD
jgi:hypothetical protein